jgi:hypothetical protein
VASKAWARSCEGVEKGSGGRWGSIYRCTASGWNREGHRRLQSHAQSTKTVSKRGLKYLFQTSNHSFFTLVLNGESQLRVVQCGERASAEQGTGGWGGAQQRRKEKGEWATGPNRPADWATQREKEAGKNWATG